MSPAEGTLLTAAEIRRARQTGTLELDNKGLTTLPSELGRLTNLWSLSLGRNRLTKLSPVIVRLTMVSKLNLNNNRLTALPPEIVRLPNLERLDLIGNQLTALPPEIDQLPNLESLLLNANRLTALPPEIGQLLNLERLDLSGNLLTALPSEIGQLTKLRTLNLSRNQLTALPPEIGHLTKLRSLNLDGNRLATLPPELGHLTNLESLNLDGNRLTMLPPELAALLAKTLIDLDGNPLREPLPELIGRGPTALGTYLRSLPDGILQYDAKALLVGEGEVGKTSLVDALRNAPFIERRPTTHGIEIRSLAMRHPDFNVDITLRTWDFGGQQVYRITHQFFFSRRALYLVVWKPRQGHEQNEVEDWLRRIRLRVGSEARALVVATHCDERRPELDFPHLKKMFPELLVGQCEVDNRSRNGIVELRRKIAEEAARLPQMGQLINPRWIEARDEILARAETDPQIPYEEFVRICQRHHVDGEEIVTLAELMHDLGRIIYYGDDEGLRDFVVLNPEWLTKAISYVLEDGPTRQCAGELDHARLLDIWQNRQDGVTYPARYHPYFLRLMEKFDISYRLEDNEYRSLVAQLVPYNRPDLPWDFGILPSGGIHRLALVCRLSEPVPGLIAWLTVRHHRCSTANHWRGGVFLRHPIAAYASEALVELRTPNELAIDVRAPAPDLFFNVLRDSVEDLITRRWPGLGYRLFIPCPGTTTDGSMCSGQFPLDGLLRLREHGHTTYTCIDCAQVHDISLLLTGFAQPDVPLQPELERLQDQLADVVSGVNRLEGYAADTADSMRRVLRVVGTEVTDCPRLFTLTFEKPTGIRVLKFYQRHYHLVLWCEHPGHWHPWAAASYSLDQPRDWLVRISPYAILVFKALQLVAPIAGAVAGVVLTDEQLKHTQHELELMTTLVADISEHLSGHGIKEQGDIVSPGESASQLTPAQGEALRAIRILLFNLDPARAFGDLRRVQAPSGEFLWVCTTHYAEYDPGLPRIPGYEP